MDGGAAGRGRWAFGLTLVGVAWALGLLVLAFVVPVYSGEESVSTGSGATIHTSSSSTLVEENGLGVLVPLAVPALLAALVWFALHRKCSRGGWWTDPLAWTAIGVLAFFTLLTVAGVFIFPVVLLLIAAAALTPGRARPPDNA